MNSFNEFIYIIFLKILILLYFGIKIVHLFYQEYIERYLRIPYIVSTKIEFIFVYLCI